MNTMHKLWVKAEVAREDIQRAIGAHPDQSLSTPIGINPAILTFFHRSATKFESRPINDVGSR